MYKLAPLKPDDYPSAPLKPDDYQLAPLKPDDYQFPPLKPDDYQFPPLKPDDYQFPPLKPDDYQFAAATFKISYTLAELHTELIDVFSKCSFGQIKLSDYIPCNYELTAQRSGTIIEFGVRIFSTDDGIFFVEILHMEGCRYAFIHIELDIMKHLGIEYIDGYTPRYITTPPIPKELEMTEPLLDLPEPTHRIVSMISRNASLDSIQYGLQWATSLTKSNDALWGVDCCGMEPTGLAYRLLELAQNEDDDGIIRPIVFECIANIASHKNVDPSWLEEAAKVCAIIIVDDNNYHTRREAVRAAVAVVTKIKTVSEVFLTVEEVLFRLTKNTDDYALRKYVGTLLDLIVFD